MELLLVVVLSRALEKFHELVQDRRTDVQTQIMHGCWMVPLWRLDDGDRLGP